MQETNSFNYENNIMGFGTVDFMTLKSLHRFNLEQFINSIQKKNGRLLEIGCGAGIFLYNLAKHTNNITLYGCDISKNAVFKAKYYSDNKIIFVVADGLILPFKNISFETIALMDVVEHVPDVFLLLKECYRVMQSDSILHGNVPCEKNKFTIWWLMDKIKIGNKLTEKHLGHIQKLTTDELILALRQTGFEIKSIIYSRHLIGQLVSVFGFCVPKEILSRLFGPTISTNMTDYSINTRNIATREKSIIIKLLLVFQKIWYGILKILAAIAYYESLVLKNCRFMATDVHVTCIKRSESSDE
jgi:ubiquinone/menaquinone biosynthesis C-methylase UbiE